MRDEKERKEVHPQLERKTTENESRMYEEKNKKKKENLNKNERDRNKFISTR